jgi:hypothetical protein
MYYKLVVYGVLCKPHGGNNDQKRSLKVTESCKQ